MKKTSKTVALRWQQMGILLTISILSLTTMSFVNLSTALKTLLGLDLSETAYSTDCNSEVKAFTLKSGSESIGHSVWFSRKTQKVRAKYFTTKTLGVSVADRYAEWSKGKNVIGYFAGAFTDNNESPLGLTIDDGIAINKSVDTKMDGIVIFEAAGGGIRVADLDGAGIRIKSLGKVLNPRNSASDKIDMINWAPSEQATVFQTQLLYYDNEKKVTNKVTTPRERRILVVAQQANKEVVHIMFNITKSVSLSDAAEGIYDYLSEQKSINVVAMLNLDVGDKDVMYFPRFGLRGKKEIGSATNLIAYYYE
ncbi:MAG: hypothetical protein RI894_1722 [Bacteroidota bacterium]|jgi:hypothetical protein